MDNNHHYDYSHEDDYMEDDYDDRDDNFAEGEDEEKAGFASYDSINGPYARQDKSGEPIEPNTEVHDASPNSSKALTKYDIYCYSDGCTIHVCFDPLVYSPLEDLIKTTIHRLVYEHACYSGSYKDLLEGVVEVHFNPVVHSDDDLKKCIDMLTSVIKKV